MNTFLFNFEWMIPNVALASLAVVFALGYLYLKPKLFKIPLVVLWFLFLPNTIYLLSDIEYLPKQMMESEFPVRIFIFSQFVILLIIGVLTYFGGLMPFKEIFRQFKIKKPAQNFFMILINLAVGFAVVLGKVERTHSWYVFTQPVRVIGDVLNLFNSPFLILSAMGLGLLFNIIFFSFRKAFSKVK